MEWKLGFILLDMGALPSFTFLSPPPPPFWESLLLLTIDCMLTYQ